MNIVCAQCNTTYTLPDQKIPAKGAVASCKKCGGRIVIEPGPSRSDSIPTEMETDFSRSEPEAGIAAVGGNNHPAALLDDYPELADFALGLQPCAAQAIFGRQLRHHDDAPGELRHDRAYLVGQYLRVVAGDDDRRLDLRLVGKPSRQHAQAQLDLPAEHQARERAALGGCGVRRVHFRPARRALVQEMP